jgi:hypothetical protein
MAAFRLLGPASHGCANTATPAKPEGGAAAAVVCEKRRALCVGREAEPDRRAGSLCVSRVTGDISYHEDENPSVRTPSDGTSALVRFVGYAVVAGDGPEVGPVPRLLVALTVHV